VVSIGWQKAPPFTKALYGKNMIDKKYKVRRYITEFSEKTEELLAEYELSSFDLKKFQAELGETDKENSMVDCYPIHEKSIVFMKSFLSCEPKWDFKNKSYFVEAHAI